MTNKENRNSSIELLRIISMILIIAHHYSFHGGYDELSLDTLSIGRAYISFLSIYGKAACGIFALISGYVLADKNLTIKIQLKRVIKLIAEMLFYSILIVVIIKITGIITISSKDIIDSFLPVFKGNWYVKGYLYLCLFMPFINEFINKIDKKTYSQLIFIIISVWIVILTIFNNSAMNIGQIGFMFFMYLIGGYTKLYVVGKYKYNNKYNLYIGLIFAFLLGLSVIVLIVLGYLTNSSFFIDRYDFFMDWNSVLSFGMSYFLFLYCCNKEYHNTFINKISSTCVGVYLIHDNDFVRTILWKIIFPNVLFVNNPYFHSLVKIVSVFILCSIIDLVRQKTIDEVFDRWLNTQYDGIYKKIENIYLKISNTIENL